MRALVRRTAVGLSLVVVATLVTMIPASIMSAAEASCSAITVHGTALPSGSAARQH